MPDDYIKLTAQDDSLGPFQGILISTYGRRRHTLNNLVHQAQSRFPSHKSYSSHIYSVASHAACLLFNRRIVVLVVARTARVLARSLTWIGPSATGRVPSSTVRLL